MIRSKIRIIYLTKPYKNYNSAGYQYEFIKYMQIFFEVKIIECNIAYLPEHLQTNLKVLKSTLDKIINDYDFLIFGHHWLGDHPTENIVPLGLDFLAELNIKKIAVLNKEWIRLADKIKYINFLGCTHLISHHPETSKLVKDNLPPTKIKIITSIFGIDSEKWSLNIDHSQKKYDLFFSGILHNSAWPNEDQAVRIGIEDFLFHKLGRVRLLPRYPKIYWNAFTGSKLVDFLNRYKRLDTKNYLEGMAKSFVVPVTLSMGIISPRIFEVLASGAVPLVDKSDVYKIIDNLESHVVFFDRDLKGFQNSWEDAINLSKNPRTIIQNREFVFDNHTWECRFSSLQEKLELISH